MEGDCVKQCFIILSALFVFLTIGAFVRYVECGKRRWYFAAILAFALSLLSKMTLVTLPLVLLLIDYWPANRYGQPGLQGRLKIETFWKRALEKLPFFGLSWPWPLSVIGVTFIRES